MPPQGRPGQGGPQQQDPALRKATLQLDLAQTKAQFPSDDDFEAVLAAQANAQRAQREATRTRISNLQTQIDALDNPPADQG